MGELVLDDDRRRFVRGRFVRFCIAALVILVLLAPWLRLVPGMVWTGVAVYEPCDTEARDHYGADARVLRSEVHARLWAWPSTWVCPIEGGGEVTVP